MNRQIIENNAKLLDIPITVFESDIFDAVYEIEKSPCYLCARMRRGYLYSKAKELGCNKIALGHHYDDVIETILMGMLYGAQVQTMMPKLHSTNFEGMELIRPMYLIREDDIKHWRDYNGLHFIQCACKFTDTCTTCNPDGVTKSKRMETKQLIAKMKEINPYVESNIFKSVENVNLKTIIAYKKDGVKHSFLDTYDQEKLNKNKNTEIGDKISVFLFRTMKLFVVFFNLNNLTFSGSFVIFQIFVVSTFFINQTIRSDFHDTISCCLYKLMILRSKQ